MKNKLFLYFFISLALHLLLLQVPEGNKKAFLKESLGKRSEREARIFRWENSTRLLKKR